METIKIRNLIDELMQCKENCYASSFLDDYEVDKYEYFSKKALLIVYETRTPNDPYGFISQKEAFKKLYPLPSEVNGSKLAYDLSVGKGFLKLHCEVGKNWILTREGHKRVQEILEQQKPCTPLIDEDRKFLIQGCQQSILFVSEAPSCDAWEKHVLVDKRNNFLMEDLLPYLQISLEEFEKYFFWVHYSNCFPGLREDRSPKKPKNSKCFDKYTVNFIKKIKWKAIILMGSYAYKALDRHETIIEFLNTVTSLPAKLLHGIDTPVMVLPHCSRRNKTAKNELGEKFNSLWSDCSRFVQETIKSIAITDIVQIVDQRVREHMISTQTNEREKYILILGDSQIKQNVIIGIAESYGISPSRIELKIDYEKNKRFDVNTLQYSTKYSHVLIGPNAHKMVNLGNYDNLVARFKNAEGFPIHIELRDSTGELKISKESIKNAFESLR